MNSNLYLRKANMSDRDLLFGWANDPTTRNNSFNTKLISYEDHCNWFDLMMANHNKVQFIMMNFTKPIGQARLDICGKIAEISYSIAPEYRGLGYGNLLIKLIINEVKKNYEFIDTLQGLVKSNNDYSAKVFLNAGFEESFKCYEIKINSDDEFL